MLYWIEFLFYEIHRETQWKTIKEHPFYQTMYFSILMNYFVFSMFPKKTNINLACAKSSAHCFPIGSLTSGSHVTHFRICDWWRRWFEIREAHLNLNGFPAPSRLRLRCLAMAPKLRYKTELVARSWLWGYQSKVARRQVNIKHHLNIFKCFK